jgi:histone chaperone ASF1
MSSVNITNVQVLDNPAKWPAPLQFEITFECLTPLQEGALATQKNS